MGHCIHPYIDRGKTMPNETSLSTFPDEVTTAQRSAVDLAADLLSRAAAVIPST
jgi:hypothetical protein